MKLPFDHRGGCTTHLRLVPLSSKQRTHRSGIQTVVADVSEDAQ